MYRECQLVFKNYIVDAIKPGMLFLNYIHPIGWQVNKIDKAPQDSDAYIASHGYPVEPWIVDTGNPNIPHTEEILATPNQIGWMDEGEHKDEICDIEPKHINIILDKYSGWIDIEVDEDGEPVLFRDKVTIFYPQEIDDEDDGNDDDNNNKQNWSSEDNEAIF